MNHSLIRMAKQASDNASLMASLVRRYGERKGKSWEEIARELRLDASQMAKLALCRAPRRTSYSEDIAQIAEYVGMNEALLQRFVRQKEATPVVSGLVSRWRAVSEGVGVMFSRRTWAFGIAAVVLLILGAVAFAQPRSTTATLVVSEGSATVSRAGASILAFNRSEQSVSAGDIASVSTGDRIVLGPGSSAQLRLFDGTTVDIFENSTVDVTSLYTTEDDYRVGLNMLAGKTVSRVIRLLGAGDAFRISTPSSTASVRGTIFTVEVIDADTTLVVCDEGVVQVAMGSQSVDVVAGTKVEAVVGETMAVEVRPDFVPPGEEIRPEEPPGQPDDRPPSEPPTSPPGPPDGRPVGPPADPPGNSGETPANDDAAAPGNSSVAPGQTGETPGRSGEAPGRSGETPGQSPEIEPPGRGGTPPGHSMVTPGSTRRNNPQKPAHAGNPDGNGVDDRALVDGSEAPGLAKKGWVKGSKTPPGSVNAADSSGGNPSANAPGQNKDDALGGPPGLADKEHPQGAPPGQTGDNPGQGDPPDSPPGKDGEDPPGNSGNAPGQNKP